MANLKVNFWLQSLLGAGGQFVPKSLLLWFASVARLQEVALIQPVTVRKRTFVFAYHWSPVVSELKFLNKVFLFAEKTLFKPVEYQKKLRNPVKWTFHQHLSYLETTQTTMSTLQSLADSRNRWTWTLILVPISITTLVVIIRMQLAFICWTTTTTDWWPMKWRNQNTTTLR